MHDGTGEIPSDELLSVLADLGVEPSMSQAVEMLSVLPDGQSTFSFEELCAMFSKYHQANRRKRRRRSAPKNGLRRGLAETASPMVSGGLAGAEEALLIGDSEAGYGKAGT